MTLTTPWTAPAPVQHQLATREGFAQAVSPASSVYTALRATLVVGLLLAAYNVLGTIRTLAANDLPSSRFFEVFFITKGETGAVDPKLFLIVWGPVVLIPVAAILLVAFLATRDRRNEAAYASYSSGGYAGWALGLPISFAVNRTKYVPQVLMPAGEGSPQAAQWFDALSSHVHNLDKSGSKALVKALTRALTKDDVAIPATKVFPEAPPYALLVRASATDGARTVRAVVPGPRGTQAYEIDPKKIHGLV